MVKERQYSLPEEADLHIVCEPVARYSAATHKNYHEQALFSACMPENSNETSDDVRVVELFAGVGGFRIGLERASKRFKTIWNNQWEPSTKRQDASLIYSRQFGIEGHSNEDINTVPTSCIPEHDLLVGGFPCQDYSVATTLKNSGGIEGKKGVLWWQIYRIISEMVNRPKYLFFENVDRLLKSPASQRGRDFGIILASLADLDYTVEWRVINAAEYGMPQRRRRTYITGYLNTTKLAHNISSDLKTILSDGIFAQSFPAQVKEGCHVSEFAINGNLAEISANFKHEFHNAGVIKGRDVTTVSVVPIYDGPALTLGELILPDSEVPKEFFIDDETLPKWKYLKGAKKETRVTADGYEYKYSEGAMAFPDSLDKPSRTIITGEGGQGPSRFKHVIKTDSGRYRRLTPMELERLNMFPDNHTKGASDLRRAFLMGNALVTGIVEKVGLVLISNID
ncbi:DNA (cytosine-5-)-methyltransferase [Palleniella muris]|nr:DNA (cytosine-5-)-methyltransferase [Palleniella muris]